MRIIIEKINFKDDIKVQLEDKLKRASSVLFLIATSLADKIIADNLSCQEFKTQVCIVYFQVKSQLRKKVNNFISKVYSATSRSIKKLAIEILKKVISDEDRQIKFTPTTSINEIWKSPIYIFRKKENFGKTKEILLDETC